MSKIAFAHNPDLSNIIISKTDNGQVILQINSSLTAFQQEVNFINGQGVYKSPEDFRNLVIKHFNTSFSMIINGNDTLQFKNPKVFLGHETKLVAEITGLPDSINSIQLKNELFKDIHRNQSVVIFLLDGFPKEKFTLNTDNQQEINIALRNGNWVNSQKSIIDSNPNYLAFLGSLLVLVLIIYLLVNRKFKR
ncbi:hypothetical protein [Polaribacter sp. Asnod1-A03]|uniref:hypothetical protein n=1 Tax=Polaribacter sp. Asnod1-A03 TaxID=3160581 RepID=UPI003862EDAA